MESSDHQAPRSGTRAHGADATPGSHSESLIQRCSAAPESVRRHRWGAPSGVANPSCVLEFPGGPAGAEAPLERGRRRPGVVLDGCAALRRPSSSPWLRISCRAWRCTFSRSARIAHLRCTSCSRRVRRFFSSAPASTEAFRARASLRHEVALRTSSCTCSSITSRRRRCAATSLRRRRWDSWTSASASRRSVARATPNSSAMAMRLWWTSRSFWLMRSLLTFRRAEICSSSPATRRSAPRLQDTLDGPGPAASPGAPAEVVPELPPSKAISSSSSAGCSSATSLGLRAELWCRPVLSSHAPSLGLRAGLPCRPALSSHAPS
mmetsp:Transcript_90642/g.287172  ORF Transcript_90642/g.287172 Transcript_90642/m.287172 type:complete len:322 (-) Transcript_90642:37-1002(-)